MELLERTPFLATLAEYAAEARRGDGRLVLVSGESGMGKTVLLEAFQQRMPGARWLWGGCDGLLTPRPLGPLFDISAQLGGGFADLCDGGAPRDRLFTGFLAELGPPAAFTIAVIEDVHWADEATIDLLSFLGRRLGRVPALLLATYPDDAADRDGLIEGLLLGRASDPEELQRWARHLGYDGAHAHRVVVIAAESAEAGEATAGRRFRLLATPERGCASVTQFVGFIPVGRAPDHFHTYDEVIYVLDGHGVMHASGFEQSLRPGSCIQLPARTVHCVENTGEEPMRVVAVFRPPGSPAAAFYSDGTPAYQG